MSLKSDQVLADYVDDLYELGQICIKRAKGLDKTDATAEELQALAELTMSATDVFNTLNDPFGPAEDDRH